MFQRKLSRILAWPLWFSFPLRLRHRPLRRPKGHRRINTLRSGTSSRVTAIWRRTELSRFRSLDGAVVPYSYDAVNVGGIFSAARYFNRYIGVQAEFAEHRVGHRESQTPISAPTATTMASITVGGGLIARFPAGNITPFIHALGGCGAGERTGSQRCHLGPRHDGRRRHGLRDAAGSIITWRSGSSRLITSTCTPTSAPGFTADAPTSTRRG